MNGENCDVCHKPINIYGHSFIKIETWKNSYTPESCERGANPSAVPCVEIQKTIECCSLCTLEALKNILIGKTALAEKKFMTWVKQQWLKYVGGS